MGRWADHHRKGITFTSLRKSEIRSYRNGSLVFYLVQLIVLAAVTRL